MLLHKSKILIFFCLIATLQLVGEAGNITWLANWNKVLLMPVLLVYFVSYNQQASIKWIIALSIIFSWFGDIFLLFGENELLFLSGMLSFLIAHVFYIVGFTKTGFNRGKQLPLKLLFVLIMAVTTYFCLGIILPGAGAFSPYLLVYSMVLIAMGMSAFARLGRTCAMSFWMTSVGSILFIISDTLIAYTKFVNEIFLGGFSVMFTYIVAQFLIISGLMAHKEVV